MPKLTKEDIQKASDSVWNKAFIEEVQKLVRKAGKGGSTSKGFNKAVNVLGKAVLKQLKIDLEHDTK